MPTIERPTVSLFYEDWGDGDPPIVFLHGWCDSATSWAATAKEFSARHRVIVPEMRGHGRSGMPRDHAFFPEALANDVVAIAAELGIERPILVGHSFGGFLAAQIARREPGFARAVVVVDQPLELRSFQQQMQAVEAIIRTPETHMAFRDQLFGSMVSEAMPDEGRHLIEASKHATPIEVGQALWAPLFEYTAAEMSEWSESLMAAMGNQPSLSVDAAPQQVYHAMLGRHAPKARTAVIPGGHWIHLEHPAEFSTLLREFIDSV